jgi:hypothetical protein
MGGRQVNRSNRPNVSANHRGRIPLAVIVVR